MTAGPQRHVCSCTFEEATDVHWHRPRGFTFQRCGPANAEKPVIQGAAPAVRREEWRADGQRRAGTERTEYVGRGRAVQG